MGERIAKRVLLVGWDAADWWMINPLIEAGTMPAFEKLINRGVMGKLASLTPMLSPMLWTSIATGKRPDKHGILGFVEPAPDGNGIQPVCSTSRKCKAIWNILTEAGLRTHVAGWYASHPAEPINGICVSNRFGSQKGPIDSKAHLPPETVSPASMQEVVSTYCVHPTEITIQQVLPFIPKVAEIPHEHAKPVTRLQEVLSDCASMQALATHLLTETPWDFMAVYFDAIDLFGHFFMTFHPPKMTNVDQMYFEWYQHVMNTAYQLHDMMLHTLQTLAGEDTTVIVMSDHGFYSDHLRPLELPDTATGAARWHRPHGVLAMAGPGICKDELVYGASILDITPTILHLFGLPVGKDMDGKVLASALTPSLPVERIESWDKSGREAGMHPPDKRVDPFESQLAIQQLVDLGYLQAPSEDQRKQASSAKEEAMCNLAVSLIDAGDSARAEQILLQQVRDNPDAREHVLQALVHAQLNLGKIEDAKKVLAPLQLDTKTPAKWHTWMAHIESVAGNPEKSLEHCLAAEALEIHSPALSNHIGQLHLQQRKWTDAQRMFLRATEMDPDSAGGYFGLGIVALRSGNFEDAASQFLRTIGLAHGLPRAHFYLGVALARLGRTQQARQALEIALQMQPGLVAARRYLAAICYQTGDFTRGETLRKINQAMIAADKKNKTQ